MRAPATIVAALLAVLQPARAADVDVVVQAGHQGRPQSCAALAVKACNLGTGLGPQREREWTPIVADVAAQALRHDGFTVMRRPADYHAHDRARIAVFLHFDGSAPPCHSGASVGFPPNTDPSFVHAWENRYRSLIPFAFVGENITKNEAQYYGYRKVETSGKSLLIEFGEMTCVGQERWMQRHLRDLGITLAQFIRAELRPESTMRAKPQRLLTGAQTKG